MRNKSIDLITLGCSKNLVDSERLIKMFENIGYKLYHNPSSLKSKNVIINTCGFIGDAKEESIDTILQYVNAKNDGQISHIYVMGCLSERYREELKAEIPEVDVWYGKFDWKNLVQDIANSTSSVMPYDRAVTTPSHYAYIKIAEGCNRYCSFCAIPLITGRFTSRPIDEIVAEVKLLADKGIKEFNIIAQDLSSYGLDLYGAMKLPELIEAIADVPGVKWIRLHYAYPAQFPMELLDVIARRDNVCKYIDIALQHINNDVLKNMRRHINAEETRHLLSEMRKRVPGLHIRTTLMVGFPGEGDLEFDELLEFVKEQRFDRMGAFAYCEEEDTYAAQRFKDEIPDDVKDSRLSKLMSVQENISHELNRAKIGKTFKTIIDREENDYYIGRTEWDSPEVDPEVLIKKDKKLQVGNFYDVKIVDALPFELIGEIV